VLRISVINVAPVRTLKIEGKLTRHTIGEVARLSVQPPQSPTNGVAASRALVNPPEALELDLSDVTFMDDAAAAVVRMLLRRGISLGACSPLVRQMLKEFVS
jgi:hypothetical protein